MLTRMSNMHSRCNMRCISATRINARQKETPLYQKWQAGLFIAY